MTAKREKIVLTAMICLFIIALLVICAVKYRGLGYNGFDLAIYNQTFWNTVHGRFFANSINPPTYLGDHAEWLILALAPFYALIPHPFTLVALKLLALGLSAIIIWKIAAIKFADARIRLLWPLLYLANPYLWNLALFEFHLIAFAVPITLLAAYFFLKNRALPYIAAIIALQLCREDMAIMIAGFALLGAFEILRKRKPGKDFWIWILLPLAIGAIGFFVDQKIIAHFNPDGQYKYLTYYAWLGSNPAEIIANIFRHPLNTILHLLKPNNFTLAFVLLLPGFFTQLLRPRFLLVILPVMAEYTLINFGADLVVIKTQYAAAFIPALTIAAMEGYEWLAARKKEFRFAPKPLFPIFIAIATLYGWLTFGPGTGLTKTFFPHDAKTRARLAAIAQIPADSSVATTFDGMTALSSRASVYPMTYFWTGKKQYGTSDYLPPSPPDYLLVDQNDFVYYAAVYPRYEWSKKIYPAAAARFRDFLSQGNYGVVYEAEGVAVLRRGAGGRPWPFFAVHKTMPQISLPSDAKFGTINFLGTTRYDGSIRLFFRSPRKTHWDLVAKIDDRYYPLGTGIYPTADWQEGETVEIEIWGAESGAKMEIGTIVGGLNVESDGRITLVTDEFNAIGKAVILP